MDINISVTAGLNLFRGHEKFLIQFFVKLVKNQAAFGGYKGAVRISVLLIPNIHNGLALLIDIVHHANKILFVIPIVAVALGHNGLYILQRALYNIVHNLNRNLLFIQLIHLFDDSLTNMPFFFLGKFSQRTIGTFSYRINNLLHIKCFQAAIFLDYFHNFFRMILQTEILSSRTIRFKFTTHTFPPWCFAAGVLLPLAFSPSYKIWYRLT